MLGCFLAVSSDLALFEHNPRNRSMEGLSVLLDLIKSGIDNASEELELGVVAVREG